MVEKFLRTYNQIEKIESPGLSIEILKKKTKDDTFSSFILSRIKIARDRNDWTTAKFLEEEYRIFQKYHPRKLNKVELVNWKGKDSPEIFKDFDEDFVIIEHGKDKEGEVKRIEHKIPKENVNFLKNLIKDKLRVNEKMVYRKTIGFIIDSKSIPTTLDSFNGGKNRDKYYFPFYQFPARILEELGIISYSSRGEITRLK